jgi:hypothetical protein
MMRLGIFLWVLGYIAGRIKPRIREGEIDDSHYIRPPLIIYVLCGFPKYPHLPFGVMGYNNLYGQLLGILWIAYELIFNKWPYPIKAYDSLGFIITLLICTIVIVLIDSKLKYKPE